jgi:DNA/RNA endonuclease YhcR with UshA esterase domain
VIAKDARKAFPADTAKAYAGKRVKVTGKIEIYGGTAKIILDQPTQITIEKPNI